MSTKIIDKLTYLKKLVADLHTISKMKHFTRQNPNVFSSQSHLKDNFAHPQSHKNSAYY